MRAAADPIREELVKRSAEYASAGASEALARLEECASRVRCPHLLLYWSARHEAIARGKPLREHAPGVPAVDPEEDPSVAAVLSGEAWLAGARPGGWVGLLRDLHWELMQGLDAAPGELRSGPAWLNRPDEAGARRRFPPASSLRARLDALERALPEEAEDDGVLAAAAARTRGSRSSTHSGTVTVASPTRSCRSSCGSAACSLNRACFSAPPSAHVSAPISRRSIDSGPTMPHRGWPSSSRPSKRLRWRRPRSARQSSSASKRTRAGSGAAGLGGS